MTAASRKEAGSDLNEILEAVSDGALVEMAAVCDRCGAKLRFDVVSCVDIPVDAWEILQLLCRKLNNFDCPARCSNHIQLRPPLVLVHAAAKETLVACAPTSRQRELREAAEQRGWRFLTFPDYETLREALLERTYRYLAAAMTPPPHRHPYQQWPESDPQPPYAQLVLRYLHAMSEGLLPPPPRRATAPTMSAEEEQELLADWLAVAVVASIDRLLDHACDHGGPQTMIDSIGAHIPVECLTSRVLRRLSRRCVSWDAAVFEDSAAFEQAWRYEYLNAAAHAVAGVSNPRGLHWAATHRNAYVFSRDPGNEIDPRVLLDAAVLRRTVRFVDAWQVANEGRRLDEPESEGTREWFEFIGMADEHAAEMWATGVRLKLGDADDRDVVKSMMHAVFEVATGGDGQQLGGIAAFTCGMVFRSGRPEAARLLAEAVLEHFEATEDVLGAGWTLRFLATVFCEVMAFGIADELLMEHGPTVFASERELPCELRWDLLNELGNVHRYRFRPQQALQAYDDAAAVLAHCSSATESNRRMLVRNRAVALRDAGRVDEALRLLGPLLDEVSSDSIEAAELRMNIARTYADAGLAPEALMHLRAAQKVPMSTWRTDVQVRLLVMVAMARTAVESRPELTELSEAMAAAGRDEHLRRYVAGAVLHCARRARVTPETIFEAEDVAEKFLNAPQPHVDSSFLTLLTVLAEWWWDQSGREEAMRLFNHIDEWGIEGTDLPWQTLWLLARMCEPDNVADRAILMSLALSHIDQGVPADVGPSYAASWLGDKEPFQVFLATAVQRGITAGETPAVVGIDVCEFVNGREVRPRDRKATCPPHEAFSLIVPPQQPAVAVAFLESEDAIDLILVSSSGGEPTVVRLPMSTAQVRSIQKAFDRNIGSTALLASQHRKAEDVVADVMAEIGSLLKDNVEVGVHICLLPSASLLGLPLHAATANGRLLLEDHAISYGPNLTMVCDLLTGGPIGAPDADGVGLIVVPKDGDRPQFIDRMAMAANRLAETLAAGGKPVGQLRDTAATKEVCLNAFGHLRHLVLLVHGAQSDRFHGRGLCVSDGTALPRAPLPVESAPQLRRFLIDAGDLAVLPKTPQTVVSLACSSGRTVAGAGGSRIGLDRALFPNGTRTIVAPLWDVDQESALHIIEDFHSRWVGDPGKGPAEHLRRAQLAARERRAAPYHWASLVLKGNWL